MTANFYTYLDAYCLRLVASGVTLTEVDGRVIVSHPNPGRALFPEDPSPLEALQLRVDMRSGGILKLMHEGREYVYHAPPPVEVEPVALVQPDLLDPRLTAGDLFNAKHWDAWVKNDAAERAIAARRGKRYAKANTGAK